jgi:hypothetical protein
LKAGRKTTDKRNQYRKEKNKTRQYQEKTGGESSTENVGRIKKERKEENLHHALRSHGTTS